MQRRMRSLSVFLLIIVLGVVTLSARPVWTAELDRSRPNIVVILCDDLGYGDLGCYGHPHIKTPRLDRLSSGGIRFSACYSAAPVCSPSRVGLLTGRSPNRAGVYDWIPAARNVQPDARDQVHMRREEVTIPQLLQVAGYATCLAGKWHCNSHFNSDQQPQPNDFGFDHWFATQNNAAPSHENPRNFVRNGKPVGTLEGYSCQLVVGEAIAWMEKQVATSPEQPFFLLAAFHEPHEPIASPADLVATYEGLARNSHEAQYFANVENVDRAVGRLLDALDRMNKINDTLVIFTSDNGPETLRRYRGAERSYGTPGLLRGMKLWTTEAGFRVAGIVSWPAFISTGRVSHEPISSLDFLPTFCALAGATPSETLQLDGTSLLPILQGQPLHRERPLVWCYYNSLNDHQVAMRDGPWKLLARLDDGTLRKLPNIHDRNIAAVRAATLTDFELYRIDSDLNESTNVMEQHPDEAARLKQSLESCYRELVTTSHFWITPGGDP